jgi:hypothetical protein
MGAASGRRMVRPTTASVAWHQLCHTTGKHATGASNRHGQVWRAGGTGLAPLLLDMGQTTPPSISRKGHNTSLHQPRLPGCTPGAGCRTQAHSCQRRGP